MLALMFDCHTHCVLHSLPLKIGDLPISCRRFLHLSLLIARQTSPALARHKAQGTSHDAGSFVVTTCCLETIDCSIALLVQQALPASAFPDRNEMHASLPRISPGLKVTRDWLYETDLRKMAVIGPQIFEVLEYGKPDGLLAYMPTSRLKLGAPLLLLPLPEPCLICLPRVTLRRPTCSNQDRFEGIVPRHAVP